MADRLDGMRLQCLLVTQEHQLLELVRPALDAAAIEVEVRAEVDSAREICGRRHLDGIVVDCDDVAGGRELLPEIRGSRSNRMSTIFAVVNGITSISDAMQGGANIVLGKPLAQDRFQAYVEMARVSMEREHRRYFRFAVNLPVHIRGGEEIHAEGRMVNISEGGLAIRLAAGCSLPEIVRLEFDVPSIEPFTVQAKGEVVWGDRSGLIGARFLYMSEESRQRLQEWLDQLYARLALQGMEEEAQR
ncbi:MAG TPA: PilZ domain-containing protein [Terriglobales bacterium]|nr:PilZ domain-containing protein [Terriglobales bacterium]